MSRGDGTALLAKVLTLWDIFDSILRRRLRSVVAVSKGRHIIFPMLREVRRNVAEDFLEYRGRLVRLNGRRCAFPEAALTSSTCA